MAPRRARLVLASAVLALPIALSAAWAFGSATAASPVLLSQGRPALASSEGGSGYAAKYAFDGKTSTRWASISHVDPQWLRVDLGSAKAITGVTLIWDVSCATSYKIQLSNDGSTFTTAFSTTAGKGGTEKIAISGSGRYVRMYGTKRCRDRGYSLQEMQVFGGTSPSPSPSTSPSGSPSPSPSGSPTPGTNPYGDPKLVSMFNGTSLSGWTGSPSNGWIVKSGTIHGTGAGRGWLYYNRQVGTFRWIFNVRQVTGNHAPTVLIWGTLTPLRDALSAIQFQPPNGGHWDYRPGENNSGGSKFTTHSHPKFDVHQWSQCELIANASTGIARMACCPLTASSKTCKAVPVLDFKDKTAGRVGPIALQVHNSGIQDEYKSLYVESPVVTSPDQFITT